MNLEGIPSPLLLDLRELPDYPSSVVLRSVLVGLGAHVIEATAGARDATVPPHATIVVPYPAHRRVIRHALASARRDVNIIAVPLVLLNDSRVADRREVSKFHPRALGYRTADLLLGRLSSLVVADTDSHAAQMAKRLRRPVASARLGSAVELLRPELVGQGPAEFDGVLRLVHYGNFFPLQGVDVMLEAMEELGGSYRLELIGNAPPGLVLPTNVHVLAPLGAARLYGSMAQAHVLLGQFGDTPQRSMVVPTKIYDAFALGLPAITAASAELERHDDVEALELVPAADADAVVEAARRLMRHATGSHLDALGRIASETYMSRFSVARVTEDWRRILTGFTDAGGHT